MMTSMTRCTVLALVCASLLVGIVLVDGGRTTAASQARIRSSSISYTAAALADEVTSLPGIDADEIPFRHFSGYLNINSTTGKNVFYWFIESESAPATDPVVLWTNGGPGCSGMLGMLSENGPFRPTEDMEMELFEYRWNKIANMFFIEAPVGVGFSYSDTESDYTTGDDQTAADNYQLILQFLARFPHLLKNDFYISSESYGGHYMPQLALKIIKGNNAGVNQAINFLGFLVGNPYIDAVANTIYGEFPTYWGHQLVSQTMWTAFDDSCVQNGWEGQAAQACNTAMQNIYDAMGALDPYALDFPLCPGGTALQATRLRDRSMRAANLKHRWGYQMCEEDYLGTYLNLEAVKIALHANLKLPYAWAACSDVVDYSEADDESAIESAYLEVLELMPDIKMTIVSGDDDSVCATVGTQHILASMDLDEIRPWTPWYLDDQVGGYVVWYEGLSFLTVHTAGHMIPSTQPARSYYYFSQYLAGTLPGWNETSTSVKRQAGDSNAAAASSSSKNHHRHHHVKHTDAVVRANVATSGETTVATTTTTGRVRSRDWHPSRVHRALTELPYRVPRAADKVDAREKKAAATSSTTITTKAKKVKHAKAALQP